jgi:hypothetical protein
VGCALDERSAARRRGRGGRHAPDLGEAEHRRDDDLRAAAVGLAVAAVDLGAAQVRDRDGRLLPPRGDLERVARDLGPAHAVTAALALGPRVEEEAVGAGAGHARDAAGGGALDRGRARRRAARERGGGGERGRERASPVERVGAGGGGDRRGAGAA